MTVNRVIIHADVDAFYASVEQRDRPELRGRPIAVGGSPDRRGVIMTASYEARKFGVHSAMPSRTALRLCPRLVLVPPRFDAYHQASSTIMGIFAARSSTVEPLSLDEAFLDLSDRATSVGEAIPVAEEIKIEVRKATELTVSLGVASGKLVAKIASDYQKPDGLTYVAEGEAREFLAPLPIRRLWGVGPKTEQVLKQAGIDCIGQLADAEDEWLLSRLGGWALSWRAMARGEDRREVSPRDRSRSISREMTFDRDTDDGERLKGILRDMAASLAKSLDGAGPPRTVHIKLRYADFTTITRQRRSDRVLVSAEAIGQCGCDLLDDCWNGGKVRLIGIGLSHFVERAPDQLSLFPDDST